MKTPSPENDDTLPAELPTETAGPSNIDRRNFLMRNTSVATTGTRREQALYRD